MAIITTTISNIHGGISQQPARKRNANQVSSALNASFSVVDGASKRNPLKYKHHISALNQANAKYHVIDRDDTEQYLVKIISGQIKVYDLHTGNEKAVNYPEGVDYITTTGKPNEVFELKTLADYTFITNKTVRTAMHESIVIDQAEPPVYWQDFDFDNEDFTEGRRPTRVWIPNPAGTFLSGSVSIFAELPKSSDPAPPQQNSVYKVQGDENRRARPYYVRRDGQSWIECTKPNIQNSINNLTMPWALRSNNDGTFDFIPFNFDPRRVGDEESNPPPSFVGNFIKDIIFHRNRLGFVSCQNLILSRSGDFKTFFRSTVAQSLLDDDMIDINTNSSTGSDLEWAVPSKSGLLLFSTKEQHLLDSSETLTPTKLRLNLATSYRASKICEPISLGADTYFPTQSGASSKLQRYFTQGDSLLNQASDITAHTPNLLDSDIYQLAGSAINDTVFAISKSNPNTIYTYEFYFQGDEQVQSAWSVQSFDNHVITHIHAIGNLLYVVSEKADGIFVSTMNIEKPKANEIHVDNQQVVTGTYNDTLKESIIGVNYDINQVDFSVFSDDGIQVNPVNVSFIDGRTIKVKENRGDPTGASIPYIIGNLYEFNIELSEQFLRDSRGAPVNSEKTLLKSVSPSFTNSHDFKININPYGQDTNQWNRSFTINTVGDSIKIDELTFESGSQLFAVGGFTDKAKINITSKSPYPVTITSITYELRSSTRGNIQ